MYSEDAERIKLIKNFKEANPDMQYTDEEVASILGLLPKYVQIARQSKNGVSFQTLGERVFYLKKDILEWCNRNPGFITTRYYLEN